ncbi:hypothetical protein [Halostella salina]|uniref:hypothetical protein n=1 Tax=Halostella salina TaxID=1547897 RepID=UPI000EF7AD25|nr:hypothetical protein [Halostella salina]
MEGSKEPNESDGWESQRLQTTYEEARCVLEAQQQTVADIDDKAMRTVRITIVLIGILISAREIAGADAFSGVSVRLGGGFLFASLCFGVYTYSESSVHVGPTKRYIHQLVEDDFDQDVSWDEDLLRTYAVWIDENGTTTWLNARLLLITQLALLSGVALIGYGVVF